MTEQYANVATWWILVRYISALGRSVMVDFLSLFKEFWFMAVSNDSAAFNSGTVVAGTRVLLGHTLNAMRFVNSNLVPYLVQCAYFARPHLVAALKFVIGATTSASVYGIATSQSILLAVRDRVLSAASVSPILEQARVPRGLWSNILKSLFMVAGMLMAITLVCFNHYLF